LAETGKALDHINFWKFRAHNLVELPAQVKLILGDVEAEHAFEELQARLQSRSSADAEAPLGDALTLLLTLWIQPSETIVQKVLASPVVYPLLSALIVQLDRHAETGLKWSAPFTLHQLLRSALDSGLSSEPGNADLRIPLPERWRARYLVALLVHHGRVAAAMELNWRALRRPRSMYTAESGRACLIASLQRWRTEAPALAETLYSPALEIVTCTL
jgi:hypothetical protein